VSWFFKLEYKLQILKIAPPAQQVKMITEGRGKEEGTSDCMELNVFSAK